MVFDLRWADDDGAGDGGRRALGIGLGSECAAALARGEIGWTERMGQFEMISFFVVNPSVLRCLLFQSRSQSIGKAAVRTTANS